MARRSGSGLTIGFFVIALILLFIIPIFAFVGAFIVYEIRALLLDRDFDLTQEEYARLAALKHTGAGEALKIAELENQAVRDDLKMKPDGTYHRGSKVGMKLSQLQPQFEATLTEIVNLANQPLNKVNSYISVISWRFALRLCVLIILAALAAFKLSAGHTTTASSGNGPGNLIQVLLLQGYGVLLVVYGSFVAIGLIAYYARKSVLAGRESINLEKFERLATESVDPEAWLEASGDTEEPDSFSSDADDEDILDTRDDVPLWNEILGVSADATKAQIEKAWRGKVALNHPDKLAQLDPILQELAIQRTTMLNLAKEEGLAAIGR